LKSCLQVFLVFILILKPVYAVNEKEKKKEEEEKTHTGSFSPDIIDAVDFGASGSNEAALIFLAVTGLVVAIAWVPYFPLLAYEAIQDKEDKIKVRQLATFQWTPLFEKEGSLNGARYSLYLDEQDDSFFDLGMAAEAGYYLTKETIRKEGGYWLLGPSMLMGDLSHSGLFGRLDLMAGSSFDADIGLVTKAELSGNWLFDSGFTLGVSMGGLFFDVNENRGFVSTSDDISFIVGANAGFAF
jgi:hypothetical protein